MKRQIKFRGKRIDNGEWVYGYLVYSEQQDRYYIGVTEIMTPVDPKTVGQYTGLKDKNGKEIYEGDEVEYDYLYSEFEMPFGTGYWEWQKAIDVVEYQGDGFCFENECMPICAVIEIAESMKDTYPLEDEYESGIKVIRNIHEDEQ